MNQVVAHLSGRRGSPRRALERHGESQKGSDGDEDVGDEAFLLPLLRDEAFGDEDV